MRGPGCAVGGGPPDCWCCLWRRWCSGRRRARPPARLGVLKAKIGQAAFAFNALPVKAVRTIDALREKQQGEAA